jgi:hypothetical protein
VSRASVGRAGRDAQPTVMFFPADHCVEAPAARCVRARNAYVPLPLLGLNVVLPDVVSLNSAFHVDVPGRLI